LNVVWVGRKKNGLRHFQCSFVQEWNSILCYATDGIYRPYSERTSESQISLCGPLSFPVILPRRSIIDRSPLRLFPSRSRPLQGAEFCIAGIDASISRPIRRIHFPIWPISRSMAFWKSFHILEVPIVCLAFAIRPAYLKGRLSSFSYSIGPRSRVFRMHADIICFLM
jgi:hypothetical protein